MIPRWVHRLYAFVTGYFWTTCPVCGRSFGGHESGGGVYWMSPGLGMCTCPDCGARNA